VEGLDHVMKGWSRVTTCSLGGGLQGWTPRAIAVVKVRIPQVSELTNHYHNRVLRKELVSEDCGQ